MENILYEAMTSESLKSCDIATDYIEFRKVLSSRDDPIKHLPCGSFYEIPLLYFFSNPTDFDMMFCDTNLYASYNHVSTPGRHARSMLIIDTTDCHIGFARLRNGVEYFRKPSTTKYDKGPAVMEGVKFHTSCLSDVLGKIYTRWRNIFKLTKDSVYAICCPLWPQDAHEFITRKRINGWPSKETINSIVDGGYHLVSKPYAKNPSDDTQWRYSFSQAETILIHNSWTDVQKYIYHLLRIIKRDVVSKCGGEDKTFLSNYYFKTSMLWACEEKPSEFWSDKNIVTSLRELLLDFIERLINRTVPHYFMPANNIMDDLPSDYDIENEIRSLLSYTDEAILEIVRKEPKAYHVHPGFIVIPNHILYPILAKVSEILHLSMNKIDDRKLQESRILSICSSDYFFPELQYLHKGIMIHLQLSQLNKCENQQLSEERITSAKYLFDLAIRKLDYGFTRFRLYLGWTVSEFYQQIWRLCGGEQFQIQNLMLYSGSCMPMTASTSCYVREEDDYLKNRCSISSKRRKPKTRNFPILQHFISSEIAIPFNATYFVCSAYRANFFCNALCNYRKAFDMCTEAKEELNCLSYLREHVFAEFLPFSLRHEWCGLYDMYIQIIFGFLTLHRTLKAPRTARMNPVYLCSVQYLRYIYTRCGRILNEPVTDFGFDYKRLCQDRISIIRFQVQFSEAILRTALYISVHHHA